MRRGRPESDFNKRFWDKVSISTEDKCWEWISAKHTQGYGLFKRKDGFQLRAHRVSYELTFGYLPTEMMVCHKCDNPGCVNPSHLFLGTALDNTRDMISKGRKVSSQGEKNGSSKLSLEKVNEIRNDGRNQYVIAMEYGISQSLVSMIKSGNRWKIAQQ